MPGWIHLGMAVNPFELETEPEKRISEGYGNQRGQEAKQGIPYQRRGVGQGVHPVDVKNRVCAQNRCSTTAARAAATMTPESIVWSRSPISSSSVNVTAAIGALNAAAMPADMPTEAIRRQLGGWAGGARQHAAHACANLDGRALQAERCAGADLKRAKNEFADRLANGDEPVAQRVATFTWGMPLPAAAGAK